MSRKTERKIKSLMREFSATAIEIEYRFPEDQSSIGPRKGNWCVSLKWRNRRNVYNWRDWRSYSSEITLDKALDEVRKEAKGVILGRIGEEDE